MSKLRQPLFATERPPTCSDTAEARRASHTRLLAEENGLALIAVLIVTGAMLTLGTIGIRSARTELQIAANDLLARKALAAAEAGLSHALSLMKADTDPSASFIQEFNDGFEDELSDEGIGGALASLGSVASVGMRPYRFRSFGGNTSDGYYVRVVDNFDDTPDDPTRDEDLGVRIISRASMGRAERIIEVIIKLDSVFSCALFAKEDVVLSGGADVDSFDSRAGGYDPTVPGSNGCVQSNRDIKLKSSGIVVNGDATAVDDVEISNGSQVTGTVTEGAEPLDYPSVNPCGPPFSDGSGITGGEYDPANGHLKGAGGASIVLADGTYCFHEVSLTGGSTLTVSGPVRIFVNHDSDMSGGAIVNTTRLAQNLQVLASCNTLKVSGGADTYMLVYAPDSRVEFRGGTDFFGSAVAKKIEDSGGTNIHFDEALRRIPAKETQVVNWREVRNR